MEKFKDIKDDLKVLLKMKNIQTVKFEDAVEGDIAIGDYVDSVIAIKIDKTIYCDRFYYLEGDLRIMADSKKDFLIVRTSEEKIKKILSFIRFF